MTVPLLFPMLAEFLIRCLLWGLNAMKRRIPKYKIFWPMGRSISNNHINTINTNQMLDMLLSNTGARISCSWLLYPFMTYWYLFGSGTKPNKSRSNGSHCHACSLSHHSSSHLWITNGSRSHHKPGAHTMLPITYSSQSSQHHG